MMRINGRAMSAVLIFAFLAAGLLKWNGTEENADAVFSQSPFTDAAKLVSKSVVGVNGYTDGKPSKAGSGVVVLGKYILTNYHVIEGADRLSVFAGGRELSAAVCAYDAALDAAVLYASRLDAASAAIGDSDMLKVGQCGQSSVRRAEGNGDGRHCVGA